MYFNRGLLLAIVLLIATSATGCLPLMIGSLGYEGYEYHQTGTLPGMPQQTQDSPSAEVTPQPDSSHAIE
jgi:hypothetical protein